MRNPRKYVVLTLFSLLLIGLFVFNLLREFWPWGSRMAHALAEDKQDYALLGAKLYAQNCMQCHGPRGEGVVGMPLNRPDLEGDPTDSKFAATYELLRSTITLGRPGSAVPSWVRAPDGKLASYTAMPAWGREAGGPMDEHDVKGLAYFIMMGNQPSDLEQPDAGVFWSVPGTGDAPTQAANFEAPLPDATNLSPQDNENAKALFTNLGKSQCLSCHAIGPRGGKVGPDLTEVDKWGVDEAFLVRWITDPTAVPNDERMPVYWSKHRLLGPKPAFDPAKKIVSPVNTQMPKLTTLNDDDRRLIARYLLSPKQTAPAR